MWRRRYGHIFYLEKQLQESMQNNIKQTTIAQILCD